MPTPERIVVPEVGRLPVFSHASVVGELIFVSGTLGSVPGKPVLAEGGMRAQTRRTLENLRLILQGAGADLEDVVKLSVYVTDMAEFGAMNEVYAEFFPEDPPARITLEVNGLALGACVEMECVARRPAP